MLRLEIRKLKINIHITSYKNRAYADYLRRFRNHNNVIIFRNIS